MLSLPVGTEMFHFPTFPPLTLCVQVRVTGHDSCRVSPFGNPRITARLTAPRGLSQPPTSFIGSWCQGIHRAPLLTWPQRCSRPLCSSQATGGHHPTPGAYPPPPQPPEGGRGRGGRFTERAIPHEQAPHPGRPSRRRNKPKPDPSGPNSVPSADPLPAPFPPTHPEGAHELY